MDKPRLLTEDEVAEIRAGVREGIRGPVMLQWIDRLLADHDERVRTEQERDRTSLDRVRERYGRRVVAPEPELP
jgi:hypothetical protein